MIASLPPTKLVSVPSPPPHPHFLMFSESGALFSIKRSRASPPSFLLLRLKKLWLALYLLIQELCAFREQLSRAVSLFTASSLTGVMYSTVCE